MLDIKFVRENRTLVTQAMRDKQLDPLVVDEVLRLDEQRRELIQEVETLRSQANSHVQSLKGRKPTSEEIEIGKSYKEKLQRVEPQLREVQQQFEACMLSLANPAAEDAPIGADESGNVVVREVGTLPTFPYQPKAHHELALALGLVDFDRAVRIAGTRAYILKGDLVLLEQAILTHALTYMTSQGFTPMTVPWMVNKEALWGTGYFPWGVEDHYTTQDNQGLIGTAEVSLTAYYQGETLTEKDLPIKLVGISPCFRREVGSYGKDTKGFIRVHQFMKVEQVVLSVADETDTVSWHERMVGYAEALLQELKLPYRVLLMCTGDMGAGQRKKYDIETWFPSQNTYRETHSASYFNDFQARRLNMRYKAKDGTTKFVYTLNNTVAATPRLLAAVLENYQQKDGSIRIPDVLQPYMKKEVLQAQTTT